MKPDIPYRRRQRFATKDPIKTTSPISAIGRFLSSGIASFIGASVASIITLIFTLNTLESFKADENIRSLALNELYKPIVESSAKCRDARHSFIRKLTEYQGYFKVISGYLSEIENHARRDEISELIKPSENQIAELFEKISKLAEEIFNLQTIANNCEINTSQEWQTLAAVLGLVPEFEALARERVLEQLKPGSLVRDDDIFLGLILRPKQSLSILLAIQDGKDGSPSRYDAAMQKIKSELVKTSAHIDKTVKEHETLYLALLKSDAEIRTLFLKELSKRFQRSPASYLSKSLPTQSQ